MVLLRCVDKHEAYLLIKEIHKGSFGPHANGHAMAKKILWVGYYWLTMESDCFNYARKSHKCQIYANKVHVPLMLLNVLTRLRHFQCGELAWLAPSSLNLPMVTAFFWFPSITSPNGWMFPHILMWRDKWFPGSLRRRLSTAMEFQAESLDTMGWIWTTRQWKSYAKDSRLSTITLHHIVRRRTMLLKLPIKTSRRSCRNWWKLTRIGIKCYPSCHTLKFTLPK